MSKYILKPSPDRDEDLYCIYSDNVDAVTVIGTRSEIRDHLDTCSNCGGSTDADARLDRADRTGSSALVPSPDDPFHAWSTETIRIMEGPGGPGWMPRGDLSAYCRALLDDDETTAARLVQPDPDEEA